MPRVEGQALAGLKPGATDLPSSRRSAELQLGLTAVSMRTMPMPRVEAQALAGLKPGAAKAFSFPPPSFYVLRFKSPLGGAVRAELSNQTCGPRRADFCQGRGRRRSQIRRSCAARLRSPAGMCGSECGTPRAPLPWMCRASLTYEPRSPGGDVLYRIVRDHFETFRAQAASLREGEGLPRFVEQAFRDYLRCGWLAGGFARFRCGDCGLDRLVAFSCKGRALCQSCGGRRMAERAAHLVDRVLPDVTGPAVGADVPVPPAVPARLASRPLPDGRRRAAPRDLPGPACAGRGGGGRGRARRRGGDDPTLWRRAQSERAPARARARRRVCDG